MLPVTTELCAHLFDTAGGLGLERICLGMFAKKCNFEFSEIIDSEFKLLIILK